MNDNVLPQDLEDECYRVALYDMLSNHPEDQKESLNIRMFERTKSYDGDGANLLNIAENEAFKNPDLTHRVLQFLQDVHRPADANSGDWKMWEAPDKHARLAKVCRRKNIPKEENTEVKEEPELELMLTSVNFRSRRNWIKLYRR